MKASNAKLFTALVMVFSATIRLMTGSLARYTIPKAPRPNSPSSSYLPSFLRPLSPRPGSNAIVNATQVRQAFRAQS